MDANSLYETAALVKTVEQIKPPEMYFKTRFFGAEHAHETEHVAVDVVKRGRRLAPFVSPRAQAKSVERAGRTAKVYVPAYVKPMMESNADDFFRRQPGEVLFGSKSPAERAADQIAADTAELIEMGERRFELMCAEALLDGKQTILGDGYDEVIDFGRDAALTATIGTKWDAAGGDPIGDLVTYCELVRKKSGRVVTEVTLGTDAASAFIKNAKVTAALDLRRVDQGAIDPRKLAPGVEFLGTLKRPAIDIYVLADWYTHPETGVETELMPAKKALLVAPSAARAMHFGAIKDFDAGLAALKFFPSSWVERNPSRRFLMLQSAPLAVPYEVDASATITVLT